MGYFTDGYDHVYNDKKGGFDIRLSVTDIPWITADDVGLKMFRVQALKSGFDLGQAYLGGCSGYKKDVDFVGSGYYEQMVDEAISDAKKALIELTKG
jgi:hypothetical protein